MNTYNVIFVIFCIILIFLKEELGSRLHIKSGDNDDLFSYIF